MPSVYVSAADKFSAETKSRISRVMYDNITQVFNVPVVEVFFNEYDSIYVNGEAKDTGFVSLMVNGPVAERDQLAALCTAVDRDFRQATGLEKATVSFVYRENDHDHVGSNGTLLSLRPKVK